MTRTVTIFIILCILAASSPYWAFVAITYFTIKGGFRLYCWLYYNGERFQSLKKKLENNTRDSNELNVHINELKAKHVPAASFNAYGEASYYSSSRFNYRRLQLKKDDEANSNIHVLRCSLSVCRNAKNQPFKYLCKYFDIKPDDDTLSKYEEIFNDYSSVEEGKNILKEERDAIIENAKSSIPWLIRQFNRDRFFKELGLSEVNFNESYFPFYRFLYISGGGNSSMSCDIILDLNNLNGFVQYLASRIKFRKSIAGQRALMTASLREEIKKRDRYSCKKCKNSLKREPNLLLEIDHIKPLSKGGLTERKNLQTLCWRCNRTKAAKY